MEINVRIAEERDVARVATLYERLHDYLETHENHPRWKRGIYPTLANAEEGFEKGWLYVAEADGELVGSVIYLREQGEVYSQIAWPKEVPGDNVYVVHVLVVHPEFFGMGVGKAILDYVCTMGKEHDIGAVRLDVYEKNASAIRLYEKCGFSYRGTIDLGLEELYGLKWYHVYEKLL
ncbi:GNAT family N-acetyltransferase [uncultured Anaerotruncus sp.]|uniref:GNAT family N-acetyltransferase n=1 Tax=uncultured Anaerotruncus sp. TaxID=905011 RepID=UPI00280B0C80|nr:GNAT family N-acetyltransferase [uncultured Anaerotruncus sp.]